VWTAGTTGSTAALNAVAWRSDAFYAVGEGATILRSADGVSWSRVPAPTGIYGTFRGVAAVAGRLVVVGDAGMILSLP